MPKYQGIKYHRERKALTIVDLAEKSDVSETTISKLEKGLNEYPSTKTLRKIADALGVKMEDLSGVIVLGKE